MEQNQYIITKCHLSSDKLGGFDTNTIDIQALVLEINLYESIYSMCITGEISIIDDKSLFDEINFTGTERLHLEIAGLDRDSEPVMQKIFVMDAIKQESRASNSQAAYTFSLIEEHGILATTRKLRNSYRGSLDEIIKKIAVGHLNKNVDISYLEDTITIQNEIRVIIPNLNPNKAIKWLTSRATTKTGSPYFIWTTIHDDNFRFGNLDAMYTQEPWNEKLPYTFNPSNANLTEKLGEVEKAFIINGIFPGPSSNLLESIVEGHYGANQETTNLNTGQIERRHFDIGNTLVNLDLEGVVDRGKQNVYDETYLLDDKVLGEYDALNIHSILSTGTYGDLKSYHDEFDKDLLTKKLESASLNNLLLKNTFEVTVPGTGFFLGKATVGDTVNLKIVNSNLDVNEKSTESELIDKKKSGKHLITKLRHTFRGTKHEVMMQVASFEQEAL
jgi:hypothetical protein|tara:strand:+ start:145 stop:1479 length:1335 start_codon:yes stop_codon:yes gene_type:complete